MVAPIAGPIHPLRGFAVSPIALGSRHISFAILLCLVYILISMIVGSQIVDC